MSAPDPGREAAVTRARLSKARALATVLCAHGAVGSDVSALPESSRRTVESLAGVGPSSEATWVMAGDLVAAGRALAVAARPESTDSHG
ncbi:MAG: hypothetical protein ABR532_01560 [Candidatus Dormibacteria bacterium]